MYIPCHGGQVIVELVTAFIERAYRRVWNGLRVERKMVERHGLVVAAVVQVDGHPRRERGGESGWQRQFLIALVPPTISAPKWTGDEKQAADGIPVLPFAQPLY